MLILDEQKISAQDLCKKFDIDLTKIKKSPVFELAPKFRTKDRFKGGAEKVPAKVSFPAKTYFRGKDGTMHELRYAERQTNRIVAKEKVTDYDPKYLFFDAAKNRVNEEEKALFLFVSPDNGTSPFGDGKNYNYIHVDPTAVAMKRMANVNNVTKAMLAIEKMNDEELIIFAKGFQASYKSNDRPFNPFVDGAHTDIAMVRVSMLEFCQINGGYIVELLDNKLAETRGQIINLVDNGVIVERNGNGVRQWFWAKGEREGQPIGHQILDPHTNSRDFLLNYIQSNMFEYYDAIRSSANSISAEAKAVDYLKNKKQENQEFKESLSYDELPSSYKECQEWLGNKGLSKAPKVAKLLMEAIEEKKVHNGNILEFAKNVIEQANSDDY